MSERVRLDYVAATLAVLALGFAFYKVLTPSPAPVPQAPVVASTPAPTTAPVAIATTPAATPVRVPLSQRLTAAEQQQLLKTIDVINVVAHTNAAGAAEADALVAQCRAASGSGRLPRALTKQCVASARVVRIAADMKTNCTAAEPCAATADRWARAFGGWGAALTKEARILHATVPAGACRRALTVPSGQRRIVSNVTERLNRASELGAGGDYVSFQQEFVALTRYMATVDKTEVPAESSSATVAAACGLHPAG